MDEDYIAEEAYLIRTEVAKADDASHSQHQTNEHNRSQTRSGLHFFNFINAAGQQKGEITVHLHFDTFPHIQRFG